MCLHSSRLKDGALVLARVFQPGSPACAHVSIFRVGLCGARLSRCGETCVDMCARCCALWLCETGHDG